MMDSASCHDMAVHPAMQARNHEKHEHAGGAQSMNKDIPPWSGFTAAVSRHPVWNEHDQAESSGCDGHIVPPATLLEETPCGNREAEQRHKGEHLGNGPQHALG